MKYTQIFCQRCCTLKKLLDLRHNAYPHKNRLSKHQHNGRRRKKGFFPEMVVLWWERIWLFIESFLFWRMKLKQTKESLMAKNHYFRCFGPGDKRHFIRCDILYRCLFWNYLRKSIIYLYLFKRHFLLLFDIEVAVFSAVNIFCVCCCSAADWWICFSAPKLEHKKFKEVFFSCPSKFLQMSRLTCSHEYCLLNHTHTRT